jgi:Uncharacterised nucleotidyltransferase
MTSDSPDIPALAVIEAALRKTTETLASELAQPTQVAPDWSVFEWLIARAVAAMHGVAPLLSRALRWEGPAGWREFLRDQRAHTAARHGRIEALLRLIDDRARSAGIGVVALKGAALHAMDIYGAGDRPMGDIDLLVRGADVERTLRLLESLGFEEAYSTWKHRVLIPKAPQRLARSLGEHADNFLKIELHERITEALPIKIEDVTERVFPRLRAGLNGYPSQASLMIHLLLHAAGTMVMHELRLLHLHDIARLSCRTTEAEWDEVLRYSAADGGYWWALPPLLLTARYYSPAIPARVLIALEAECPRLLGMLVRRRTLSDVSLSNLRIEAFPGIEWCRSGGMALRYVIGRVVPSKETLAMRAQLATTQLNASASPWPHLSQGRRLLRWLTSPQARPETMYPVQMALTGASNSWRGTT